MPRGAPGPTNQGGPSRRVLEPQGQPYGQAQQLQPMAPPQGTPPVPSGTPQARSAPGRGGAPGGAAPPDLEQLAAQQPGNEEVRGHPNPIARPTERPGEPLTAGMPQGPGPGPEALRIPAPPDDLGLFLRELYRLQPSEDLRTLIVQHEAKGPRGAAGIQQQAPPPTTQGRTGAPVPGGPQAGPPPMGPPQTGAAPPTPQAGQTPV